LWRLRNEIGDVVTQICRDSLEPADRDGLSVNASSTTGRLAWAIAGATEDAGEDVRLTVEQVRVGETSLGDEADVLGDVRVRRTGVLAVDNLMVVLRVV